MYFFVGSIWPILSKTTQIWALKKLSKKIANWSCETNFPQWWWPSFGYVFWTFYFLGFLKKVNPESSNSVQKWDAPEMQLAALRSSSTSNQNAEEPPPAANLTCVSFNGIVKSKKMMLPLLFLIWSISAKSKTFVQILSLYKTDLGLFNSYPISQNVNITDKLYYTRLYHSKKFSRLHIRDSPPPPSKIVIYHSSY